MKDKINKCLIIFKLWNIVHQTNKKQINPENLKRDLRQCYVFVFSCYSVNHCNKRGFNFPYYSVNIQNVANGVKEENLVAIERPDRASSYHLLIKG